MNKNHKERMRIERSKAVIDYICKYKRSGQALNAYFKQWVQRLSLNRSTSRLAKFCNPSTFRRWAIKALASGVAPRSNNALRHTKERAAAALREAQTKPGRQSYLSKNEQMIASGLKAMMSNYVGAKLSNRDVVAQQMKV